MRFSLECTDSRQYTVLWAEALPSFVTHIFGEARRYGKGTKVTVWMAEDVWIEKLILASATFTVTGNVCNQVFCLVFYAGKGIVAPQLQPRNAEAGASAGESCNNTQVFLRVQGTQRLD